MRNVPYRKLHDQICLAPTAILIALWVTACFSAEIPPAPGRIVDISGTKLHIDCMGTGAPAVILESGFPGVSLDWVLVQPEVAKVTKVCKL